MSNISSKIISIEPEDDVAAKALDLTADKKDRLKSVAPDTPASMDDIIRPVHTHTSGSDDYDEPGHKWMFWVSVIGTLLWIAAALFLIIGFFDFGQSLQSLSPFQIAGLAMFVFGPVFVLLTLSYAMRQLAALSEQSRVLAVAAQALLSPDDTAQGRTAVMAHNIKSELDDVDSRVDKALSRLSTMKDEIDGQIKAIDRSTYITDNKSELIVSRLTEERNALDTIAASFEQRMASLSQILDHHSENLASSTKKAEQKIQEARISVEGSAAKISSSSEIVRENTIEAATTLQKNHDEITSLSSELKIRADELDAVYRKHADDLRAMIADLNSEQENLETSLETRLQKMRDVALSAQVSSEKLTEASESGRRTVEALADAARLTDTAVKQRFTDMEEMVRYSNARAESISDKAARRVQDSLGQTRKEIARIEYDMIALQERLNSPQQLAGSAPSDDSPESFEALDPPKPVKKKKRRGLLGLRPAVSADAPVGAVRGQESLKGLRPAESDQLDKQPEPAAPSLIDLESLETVNLAVSDNAGEDMDIDLKVPEPDDLIAPDPDADLKSYDPDLLRRTVPDEIALRPTSDQSLSTWWRKLFGSLDETETVPAPLNEPVYAPAETELDRADLESKVIEDLTQLGLSPAAIVDAGCIIEAVNTRKSKGPLAMSDVIIHRLTDPVRHLRQAMGNDPDMRASMSKYALEYHQKLLLVDNDREAIRRALESDSGRAFLLCNAALNLR